MYLLGFSASVPPSILLCIVKTCNVKTLIFMLSCTDPFAHHLEKYYLVAKSESHDGLSEAAMGRGLSYSRAGRRFGRTVDDGSWPPDVCHDVSQHDR